MLARTRTAALAITLAVLLTLPACKKQEEYTPTGMQLTAPDLRMKSQNHLKMIGIAMHSFHDVNGYFPNNIAGPDAKTAGLSWRVAILPYMDHGELYKRFHLNEPWDSEHNRQLTWEIPKEYVPPGVEDSYNGYTYYRAFSGKSAFLPPASQRGGPGSSFPGLKMFSITDGTSNTLMVAEAAEPVLWTKPEDLEFDPNGPLPKLGGVFSKGANVLYADGSVRFLPNDTPPEALKALITPNGGEVVQLP